MPIEFYCPNCETLLQTPDQSEGMQATCPHCAMVMLVPGLSGDSSGSSVSGGYSEPEASPSIAPPAVQQSPVMPSSSPSASAPPSYLPPQPFVSPPVLPTPNSASPSPSTSAVGRNGASRGSGYPNQAGGLVLNRPPDAVKTAGPALGTSYLDDDDGDRMAALPREFSVPGVMAYGWDVMLENFQAFFLAAIALAILGPLLLPAPLLLAGLGALAVRAARGGQPELSVLLEGVRHAPRVFMVMGLWMILVCTWHVPLLLVWGLLFATGVPLLKVLGGVLFVAGGIAFGVRLGWAPFAVLDHPRMGFVELLEYSAAISRRRTWELVQLASLTYFAIWATLWGLCVGIVFFGVPIALGVGGAAYHILARDADV